MIERIIVQTAPMSLGACGELLARAVAALADGRTRLRRRPHHFDRSAAGPIRRAQH